MNIKQYKEVDSETFIAVSDFKLCTCEYMPFDESFYRNLGKPQKKFLLLTARPLRGEGWGGVKGRAIKEKTTFLTFFSIVLTFQRPLSSRGGGVGPYWPGH